MRGRRKDPQSAFRRQVAAAAAKAAERRCVYECPACKAAGRTTGFPSATKLPGRITCPICFFGDGESVEMECVEVPR